MNTRSIINGVDKHTHVPKEKLILNPSFPDSIKIEITSRCNYKCPYCLTWKTKRETGDIDRKFLYRIFKEAHNVGVKEIGMFLLGESFLVKDLPDYIKYAKEEVGIEYVFLTTNGSLCSPKRTIDIINSGLDSLKFSINEFNDEHNREHWEKFFADIIMKKR
jgi:MoaA/NifB/PqqE/SkfB family radical SAM enzyme